jgi:hypothetical protein
MKGQEVEDESRESKFSFGSPSREVDRLLECRYENYSDASIDDLLKVVVRSADCIWEQLVAIRNNLESRG